MNSVDFTGNIFFQNETERIHRIRKVTLYVCAKIRNALKLEYLNEPEAKNENTLDSLSGAQRFFWLDQLKGTVSRDFSGPVFFIKHLLLVPIGMPRTDFEFFLIFVELFVFVIDSPVMNTPGSRLESFRFGNFCKHKITCP